MFWLLAGCQAAKGDPAVGADLYVQHCASCHGDDGTLRKPIIEVDSANLNFRVPELQDEELVEVIQKGFQAMPPLGLEEEEALDIVAWLRTKFGWYQGGEAYVDVDVYGRLYRPVRLGKDG
jgi:mono/diheme cytochrome c family protein